QMERKKRFARGAAKPPKEIEPPRRQGAKAPRDQKKTTDTRRANGGKLQRACGAQSCCPQHPGQIRKIFARPPCLRGFLGVFAPWRFCFFSSPPVSACFPPRDRQTGNDNPAVYCCIAQPCGRRFCFSSLPMCARWTAWAPSSHS